MRNNYRFTRRGPFPGGVFPPADESSHLGGRGNGHVSSPVIKDNGGTALMEPKEMPRIQRVENQIVQDLRRHHVPIVKQFEILRLGFHMHPYPSEFTMDRLVSLTQISPYLIDKWFKIRRLQFDIHWDLARVNTSHNQPLRTPKTRYIAYREGLLLNRGGFCVFCGHNKNMAPHYV